ncbi:hypothetical protein JAAARDRAFT_43183 [Jaapia argillacea MUCL 33604]|uniref:Uncharacterized protein n=1 Tax=Jaapia argillacea MUCL 33604 TaxID=933084 RepID=A0A067QCL3_9AGAM|nr:hypothetical protein JAAARDRAFT_43183 [Jaapia argillacea MUCL 33604]
MSCPVEACEPLSGIVDPMICDMIFHFVPLLGLSRAELLIERPWYWDRIVVAYKILRLVNKQWAEYLKKFTFASIHFGRPLRRYQGIAFDRPIPGWQQHVLHLSLDYRGRDAELQNAQSMWVGQMLELRTLLLVGPQLRVEAALNNIPFEDLKKLHSVAIVVSGTQLKYGGLGLAKSLKRLQVTFRFCNSLSRREVDDGMLAGLSVGTLNWISISDDNLALDRGGRAIDTVVNSLLKGLRALDGAGQLTHLFLREIRVWEPFLLLLEAIPVLMSLTVHLDETPTHVLQAKIRPSSIPMLNYLEAPLPLVQKLLGDRPIRSLSIQPLLNSPNDLSQSDLVDVLPLGLTSLAYTAAIGDLEGVFGCAVARCRLLKHVELDLTHCIGNAEVQERWVKSLFKAVIKNCVALRSIRLFQLGDFNNIEVGILNREVCALMALRPSIDLVFIDPYMWRSVGRGVERLLLPPCMMDVAWCQGERGNADEQMFNATKPQSPQEQKGGGRGRSDDDDDEEEELKQSGVARRTSPILGLSFYLRALDLSLPGCYFTATLVRRRFGTDLLLSIIIWLEVVQSICYVLMEEFEFNPGHIAIITAPKAIASIGVSNSMCSLVDDPLDWT